MAKRTAARKTAAKRAAAKPAKRSAKTAPKRAVRKASKKAASRVAGKAPKRPPKKAGKRAVSRTAGRLTPAERPRHDLLFEELRDRVLIELAALAESDRAGDRPYKMVLVVKRGKTTPLTYKLVVERNG